MKKKCKLNLSIIFSVMVIVLSGLFLFRKPAIEYDILKQNQIQNLRFVAIENNNEVEANTLADLYVGYLRWGCYKIDIQYSLVDGFAGDEKNIYVVANSSIPDVIDAEKIELRSYKNYATGYAWSKKVMGATGVNINISGTNYSELKITEITVKEHRIWKIVLLLLEIIVFAFINVCVTFLPKFSFNRKKKLFLVILLITFSSLPLLAADGYYYEGHDTQFHIQRILSIAKEMRYGHFPVTYESDTQNGYGGMGLVMYPGFFLYMPAFLYLCGIPLGVCYNVYLFGLNLLTIFLSYFSFKGIFHRFRYAYLGCLLYTLATYRLNDIYVRAALGESASMCFFPLVIYGLYRLFYCEKRIKYEDGIPLVVGVTGMLQSHVLTVQMMFLFVLLFVFVNTKKTLKMVPVLFLYMITIIGINLGQLIPFLEMYFEKVGAAGAETSYSLGERGAYFNQIFSIFMNSDGSDYGKGTSGELPLTIGGCLIIGLLLYFYIRFVRSRKIKNNRFILHCVIFEMIALWLSSAYFPWYEFAGKSNILFIIFTSLEHVWRYLGFATIFGVIVVVASVEDIEENSHIRLTSELFVALSVMTVSLFYTQYIHDTPMKGEVRDIISFGAYPQKMSYSGLKDSDVHVVSGNIDFIDYYTLEDNTKCYAISGVSDETEVAFPVPYYQILKTISLNENEEMESFSGYNERLSICLPENYAGVIYITYELPKVWIAGYISSLVFSLMYAFYIIVAKRLIKSSE